MSYQRSLEKRGQVVRTAGKGRNQKKNKKTDLGLGGLLRKRWKQRGIKRGYFDYDLLLAIIFLISIGLIMLYSASSHSALGEFGEDYYYFKKQAIYGLGGFVILFLVSKIDYHLYGAFVTEIYLFSMLLLALVRVPGIGHEAKGAVRWIRIAGITFQPSEITKIAMILVVSYMLCALAEKKITWKRLAPVVAVSLIAGVGVWKLTDNMSTAIIVVAICFSIIFVFHPKVKVFLALGAIGSVLLAFGIRFIYENKDSLKGFRYERILSWLSPETTGGDGAYQLMQGLYAIGSGGFFGKGLGNSMQKLKSIPEAQNDWILTVICEELGVFGVLLILILFSYLLYRLVFLARNASDLFGFLIVVGVFAHIAVQVVFNICVVTGLFPSTGITLPFISYGGTALIFLQAEMGIVLNISRSIQIWDDEKI